MKLAHEFLSCGEKRVSTSCTGPEVNFKSVPNFYKIPRGDLTHVHENPCTYMQTDNSNTWCLQPLLSLVHRHRKLLQTLHFCNFSFRLRAGGEKKLPSKGIRHCELNDYYLTDKSSVFQATRAEETHVLKCRLVRHKILFLYVCLSGGSVFSHVEPVGQVHTVQTRCDLITSNRSRFVS